MNTKAPFCVVLMCAALSGCAHHAHHGMRAGSDYAECRGQTCNLRVSVENCRLSVAPKTLLVVGRNVESTIHWKLEGPPTFKFPRNGITFKGGTPSDFRDCGPSGNGNQFSCKNVHTESGAFKYDVRVDGLCNGQPVPPLDPFIMND
jgi:hypothetical protein